MKTELQQIKKLPLKYDSNSFASFTIILFEWKDIIIVHWIIEKENLLLQAYKCKLSVYIVYC